MLEETTTHIKEDNSSPITDKIFFLGQGKDLFSIMLLNVLLTIITLGIYYPWAKASYLKYVYRETEFKGGRFTFHGTGKELFIGMIKALLVLIILISASFLAGYLGNPFYAYVVYIPALFFLYPLAIVGSLKYRTSRSSWNGIHFGYRGTYSSMLKVHAKGLFLTIITLGIYYAWYLSSLYKEILSNVRFGNIQLNYSGRGVEFFGKFLIGYLLTIVTLGMYAFKWQSELHNYVFSNVKLQQDKTSESVGSFNANTTGLGYFKLQMGNLLILILTLGLGAAWTVVRTLNYFTQSMEIESNIDFNNVKQTEANFADASGEGFADSLDLQLI